MAAVNSLRQRHPLGRYDLRQEIADRFSKRGTIVSPDQVLITNGSMQAITLVAQANLEAGYKVVCETPCFKGITEIFTAMGHWVETITRDKQGPLPELPSACPVKILFCSISAPMPITLWEPILV